MKCHKVGCTNTNNRNGSRKGFRQVPSYPSPLKSSKPRLQSVVNYGGRYLLHEEIERRLGCSAEHEPPKEMFVCWEHKSEVAVKTKEFKLNGQKRKHRYKLIVPPDFGPKSSRVESTESKGLGIDRSICKTVESLTNKIEELDEFSVRELKKKTNQINKLKAECGRLTADLMREKLLHTQVWEHNTNSKSHIPINPVVKRVAGIDVHEDFTLDHESFVSTPLPSQKKRKYNVNTDRVPVVTTNTPDDEVKRRTGFQTMNHLLFYIFIACNGVHERIVARDTVLTWFEEWFFHFEYKWGRTIMRLLDAKSIYRPDERYLRKVIVRKYAIERHAKLIWPMYASYAEDCEMRRTKWNVKYVGVRVVMWDMTNIPAFGFTDADCNRITYSRYYNQNCFNGGVFAQLCGWIGTYDLWTGAVSDTDYNKRAGYLKIQKQYAENDLVNSKLVPFTNIYDKGYRARCIAWKEGHQLVLQPEWAESDKRFNRQQTLLTASVATDRGGNERAVNVCKRAGFIKAGFQPNSSPKILDDAWITWGFQANFMFNPIQ